jgi:type IV pilus assembly protein PilA
MRSQRRADQQGFTLVELLIAIVVVGVLTAVAIVGIGALTNNGKSASCQATIDASRSAEAVYYANTGGHAADFTALTTGTNPPLQLNGGTHIVAGTPTEVTANGWIITLGANGAFTASGVPAGQTCS